MTLTIKSTSVCDNSDEFSSVKLAVDAGESCISYFDQDRGDIDLLINIGIYRDRNIIEPAMSSLIQKGLQLNNDPLLNAMTKTTFSFDIVNGTPSFINAIEVIDSMITTGASKNAIIVSSDTHPSQSKHDGFPFRNFGAAMILSRDNHAKEKPRFFYKSSQDGYIGMKSHFTFQKNAQKILQVDVEDDYFEKLLLFTINAIKEGIDTGQLDLTNVTAVITSQPGGNFGKSFAEGIGLSGDLAIDTFDEFGDTHSSALILGYHKGIESGKIKEGDQVVFVAAGSGLSMGCCVL